ncbi:MAG: hypothetical protein K0R00_197 [Herbinix sp.]|jgi:hypothetical protein|nr:hypothetical protein [Herbinix sp.]
MNRNRPIVSNEELQDSYDLLKRQFEYLHERLVYLERRRWWQFWKPKTAYEYRKEDGYYGK